MTTLYTYPILACMVFITFVPLAEAARSLGVDPSTLRHQIRLRRFSATKIGRGWYATPEAVEHYRTVVQGKTA